ncbi:MAG: heme o synthase [Acidimicrobiia bacterium]|nr:heme o synthase [Acidimicrobiia bacterium]
MTRDTSTRPWSVARTYLELTKPRIIELLLITTIPAMAVAADGWPGLGLVVITLIGGALSAGGANVINQVYDDDIDRLMRRTEQRPLPTDRVSKRAATVFGVALGIGGFVVLAVGTTVLAGILSVVAYLFYVFVYTMTLKRSSTQNIVIGGAAGAMPALIGWAAVTGDLGLGAWVMFGIIFYWTPPHFWALSLKYESDYRAAGVPMLPVVVGERSTLDEILSYSIVTFGVSVLLIPAAGMSAIYVTTALVLGAGLIAYALRVHGDRSVAMRYFGFTNVYLAGVFLAMLVDKVVIDDFAVGRTAWLVLGSAVTVLGLGMVAAVERRPGMRAEGISPTRHALEVGVTMAFGAGLVIAVWMAS